MIKLIRTTGNNPDYVELTRQLDEELHGIYGELQCKYDVFNMIYDIDTVLIAYDDDNAIGCGCFKRYDDKTVELKRMFVKLEFRNRKIAGLMLQELESWSIEKGYREFILETGSNQPQAVALYKRSGYRIIENFGQYEGDSNSICMFKGVQEINKPCR